MSQYQVIADELKIAREQSNLSIEFLANKIKIDKKYLALIEKGDFTFLPELYVKAFLRDYAKAVGLDEKLINKKYEMIKSGKDISAPEANPEAPATEENIPVKIYSDSNDASRVNVVADPMSSDKKYFGTLTKYQAIFVGIMFLFLIAFIVNYSLSNKEEKIVEKPLEEIVKSNKERFEVEDKTDETPFAFSDSLSLRLIATDSTWIQLVRDQKDTLQRYLYPRQSVEVLAKDDFNLIVGNTTGLNLLLNNKPLNLQNISKRRTEIVITKDGIKSVK